MEMVRRKIKIERFKRKKDLGYIFGNWSQQLCEPVKENKSTYASIFIFNGGFVIFPVTFKILISWIFLSFL